MQCYIEGMHYQANLRHIKPKPVNPVVSVTSGRLVVWPSGKS
jgi:hypothetical protein